MTGRFDEGITRRQALVAMAGGLAAAAATVAWAIQRDDSEPGPDPSAVRDALAVVGARALALHPSLAGSLPDGVSAAQARDAPDTVLASLAGRIADDFAEGAVLDVDGWVLSRTECQLAAAVAVA